MIDRKKNDEDIPVLGDLISLSEASKLSGLSVSQLRLLVSHKAIWGKKLGRNWLTTEKAVQEYMLGQHKPGRKPKKD
jgi:hypothetical protein